MAHPYVEHRQHKVERSRANEMARGGHPDEAADRKLIKGMVKPKALKIDGGKSMGRLDKYARGGAVKKGATNVNVIIAPQGGAGMPPMPPVPMGGPPIPPPDLPPVGAPAPMAAPSMMHRSGGRAYATGGKVSDGPAWKEGLKNGTKVQHSDGKNDGSDIYRGRQITYARGGAIEAGNSKGPKLPGGDNGEGRLAKAALQKRSKRP